MRLRVADCRTAACLLLVVLLAGGCGASRHTYSPDQVESAFAAAHLPVRAAGARDTGVLSHWNGTLLVGRAGAELYVVVFDGADSAQRAYEIVRDQATSGSLDRVERNVLLTSDGLSRAERRQALAALRSLRRLQG